jgi:hypothetical protein
MRLRGLLWWCLVESAFGQNLESVSQFFVVRFGRNLISVTVKMFSILFTL